MSNERARTNKNQKQGNSNASESDSSLAHARKFAEALRRPTRSSEKDAKLRRSARGIQGNYTARFWEDGWNE